MSEDTNTSWSRTGRAHYTRHIEGVCITARKVAPSLYGGEAEVNGQRITVLIGSMCGAKKAIVDKVRVAIEKTKTDGIHTPATDRLAWSIMRSVERQKAREERGVASESYNHRNDGMTTAWEIVTGAEAATEEALALAAARHTKAMR